MKTRKMKRQEKKIIIRNEKALQIYKHYKGDQYKEKRLEKIKSKRNRNTDKRIQKYKERNGTEKN